EPGEVPVGWPDAGAVVDRVDDEPPEGADRETRGDRRNRREQEVPDGRVRLPGQIAVRTEEGLGTPERSETGQDVSDEETEVVDRRAVGHVATVARNRARGQGAPSRSARSHWSEGR